MQRACCLFKTGAWIATAALFPAGLAAFLHPKRPDFSEVQSIPEIELSEVTTQPNGVLWVDARARRLFEKEHIPSAILLNFEEWDTLIDPFLDAWHGDKPTVVYCGKASCETSKEVAARLQRDARIDNIFVLKGGWETWQHAQQK
jgi:rhodanese-related sulfurtransferase